MQCANDREQVEPGAKASNKEHECSLAYATCDMTNDVDVLVYFFVFFLWALVHHHVTTWDIISFVNDKRVCLHANHK
jgi:hypothetical protein